MTFRLIQIDLSHGSLITTEIGHYHNVDSANLSQV
jgi:hypothetical protein